MLYVPPKILIGAELLTYMATSVDLIGLGHFQCVLQLKYLPKMELLHQL